MRKRLKDYWIFTPPLYRLAMFALLPAAILLLPVLLPVKNYPVVSCAGLMLLVYAEISADFWGFGGMARRDGQLEYLKTSPGGMEFIRTVLCVNLVRQLLTPVLLMAVYNILHRLYGIEAAYDIGIMIYILDVLLMGYFYIIIGTAAARFVDSFTLALGIASLGIWLMAMTMLLINLNRWLALALLAVFCAAAGVLAVRLILRRVKESYYDKKD